MVELKRGTFAFHRALEVHIISVRGKDACFLRAPDTAYMYCLTERCRIGFVQIIKDIHGRAIEKLIVEKRSEQERPLNVIQRSQTIRRIRVKAASFSTYTSSHFIYVWSWSQTMRQ